MVLDMGVEDEFHLILERPFLHITSTIIYMKQGGNSFPLPSGKGMLLL
jgi:hypothetical protein